MSMLNYVIVGIWSTILALVSACYIGDRVASAIRTRREAKAAQSVQGEFQVSTTQFALLGQDWEWIGDLDAGYGCPVCGAFSSVTLRQYRHKSGDIFALLRHRCQEEQMERVTDAMAVLGEGGEAA